MINRILCLCQLSILALMANAETYQWKNVAIGGGGWVSGVEFHPAEKNLIYARTDVGGAYRWNEAGKSWVPLNDNIGRELGHELGVLSLALDSRNTDRVYLMVGMYTQSWAQTGAILVSNDRGTTWSRTPVPFKVGGNEDGRGTGERLVVDPNYPARLLAGTNHDGLWLSEDFATSWKKLESFKPAEVTLIELDAASGKNGGNSEVIYVATLDPNTPLLRSKNGGASWQPVANQPAGVIYHRAALRGQSLYLTSGNGIGPNGISEGSVWKLDTTNDQWTNISPPKGQGGFGGISIDPQNPKRILVATTNRWWPRDDIFITEDDGAHWTSVLTDEKWNVDGVPYINHHKPNWLVDIAFDPFDSHRAMVVTGYGVLEARDIKGQQPPTWRFMSQNLEETVILELISPPEGAHLFSVMGDIDGFRHDDLTKSPPRLQPEAGSNNSIAFAFQKPAIMARTIERGEEIHGAWSEDSGTTWDKFKTEPKGATAGQIAINAKGNTLVWTPAKLDTFYSTDKGNTWTQSVGLPANLKPIADTVKDDIFYAYDGRQGQLYLSQDMAKTFTKVADGMPQVPDWSQRDGTVRVVPGKAGHLYITTGAALYRSTDYGKTVQALKSFEASYLVTFGAGKTPKSEPSIFVWGKAHNVMAYFRSDDNGASWIRLNDDQHQYGSAFCISGDLRVHGRLYIGTSGRGIVVGDINQ